MERIIWTEEEIRKEIRKLDRITGLNGVDVPIRFHKRGRAVGRFSYTEDRVRNFSFNTIYFDDSTMPPEVLRDVIRHEYAHFMDFINRGKSSHGKEWKQCCLIVGALPQQYFSAERVWRISARRQREAERCAQFDAVSAGMRIDHPRFGGGVIAVIRGAGLNRIADVAFCGEVKSLGLGWVCDHCPPETAREQSCA